MKTLHIVDGESTGGSLRQAGLGKKGDILSWRDALYTGPVPRGLTLRQLSRLRSRFWTGKSATEFDKRDSTLAHHADYDEVTLWFGATSICQLSLVQLLAWFDVYSRANTRLRLVSAYGGWLKPEQLLQAYDARQQVIPAITSMLREYPEEHSGLSRLERKLLRTVDSLGITTPATTVGTTLHTELVGDVLLYDMLRLFITAPHPLLRFAAPFKSKPKSYQFNGSKIGLTDTGRSVLAGKSDHITLNGIDRWIGGVHLLGHRVRWRWDERAKEIVSKRKLAVD